MARTLLAAVVALMPAAALAVEPCVLDEVTLYPEGGEPVSFEVEVADEPAEKAKGLMFRKEMADDAGMIFLWDVPVPASFWMKNTILPLDIIFIGDDGLVQNIAEGVPFSERSLPSDGPVRMVLEINQGLSETHGIGPGTPVRHPAFEADTHPHACD